MIVDGNRWKRSRDKFLSEFGLVNDIGVLRGKVCKCHQCDNHVKADSSLVCINPLHWYWGTPKENIYDIPSDLRKNGGYAMKGRLLGVPKSEKHRKSLAISAKKREKKWQEQGGRPKFQCLVTGYISTGTGLTHYQKFRNIDIKLRKRI